MKKIYRIILLLTAMAMAGLSAKAAKIAVEWNEPGVCLLQTDSYQDGTPVEVPAGATSYVYDVDGPVYFYLLAKEGYKFESVAVDGKAKTPMVRNGIVYWGEFFGSTADVKIDAKLTKIERTSTLSIEVENGAAWLAAEFNDGYSVALSNGSNNVAFDPELETSMTLRCLNGVKSCYSVTLNGTELKTYTPYSNYYYIDPVKDGDRLAVRVFEGEEPVLSECTVTLRLPEGFEDCVYSVHDWSASKFLEFVDGKLTVYSGTDLAINFREGDYTYTSFTINGVDAMSKFKNNTLRFTVEENTVVGVEGTVTEYEDVLFNAYIANPEGVVLYLGYYQQNPADLSDGTVIDQDILIDGFLMTPENAAYYQIPVSSKRPMIFVAPREGYYISTVQGREGKELVEASYVDGASMTTFYVVAKKLEYVNSAKVIVNGPSDAVILRASSRKSQLWDNPATVYSLTEGENTVKFIPEYDLPFTISPLIIPDNFGIFLDGAALAANDDGVYIFNVYFPEDGEEQTAESVITVAADGKPARISRTVVTCEEGMTADFYYGAVRTPGLASGQMLLAGTPITIVPLSKDCTIKAGDVVVNGYESEDKYVYGLNEAGEYETVTGTANVTYTVAPGPKAPEDLEVVDLVAGGETVTVISVDGKVLLTGASSDSLKGLAKGLYIVNGKKRVLK